MNVSSSTQSVAQSIEAVNQVLQNAQSQSIEHAEKLVKANAEISLASTPGKGGNIDVTA